MQKSTDPVGFWRFPDWFPTFTSWAWTVGVSVLATGTSYGNGNPFASPQPPNESEVIPWLVAADVQQEEHESVWQFGIEATAVTGSRNVRIVAPIPVDWPEQDVLVVDELKTDNVTVQVRDLDQRVRMLFIQALELAPGEVARVVLTVKLKRRSIAAPLKTEGLSVPAKVTGDMKRFLQASPFIEIGNRKVKDLAGSIDLASAETDWEKIELIYDAIREKFPYQFDPVIRTCMDAIAAGHGDCEELTSLFIAVCRINKIPARAVWVQGHTYAEFYLVDSEGEGRWYPCQLAGTRLFGEMQETKPILQKGDKFSLPLDPQPTRYVAPQLTAEGGELTLTFIARELEPSDK